MKNKTLLLLLNISLAYSPFLLCNGGNPPLQPKKPVNVSMRRDNKGDPSSIAAFADIEILQSIQQSGKLSLESLNTALQNFVCFSHLKDEQVKGTINHLQNIIVSIIFCPIYLFATFIYGT